MNTTELHLYTETYERCLMCGTRKEYVTPQQMIFDEEQFFANANNCVSSDLQKMQCK